MAGAGEAIRMAEASDVAIRKEGTKAEIGANSSSVRFKAQA